MNIEVCSLPHPQWGIPAAADAANQIDAERFKSFAAQHTEAEDLSHFAAFSVEEEEDADESYDDDIASVAISSEGTPISRAEATNMVNYQRQYPHYNQHYYQSFRQGQGQGPQHWGFWKNGLDNMYYFLSSFFSQSI